MEKLIVTVALTGSQTTKEQTSYLPMSPEEIAEDAHRCYNVGASIVHLHPREPDPKISDFDALCREVMLIREKCPIITQIGTGARDRFGRERSEKERFGLMDITPKPDMETINTGTFIFRNLSRHRPPGAPEGWFLHYNTPEIIETFAKGLIERGIGIEFEIYDSGGLFDVERLYQQQILPTNRPVSFNLVMGVGGGIPVKPQSLFFLMENLPSDAHWTVMGIGRHHFTITTFGMLLGSGGARVGLEDNIYLSKGVKAKGNVELVEKIVRIARDIGREIATADEARKILQLPI